MDAVFWFCIGARLQWGRKNEKRIGLQPLLERVLPDTLSGEDSGSKKGPGAKARIFVGPFTARLKSCPDTKHQSGCAQQARSFLIYSLSLTMRTTPLAMPPSARSQRAPGADEAGRYGGDRQDHRNGRASVPPSQGWGMKQQLAHQSCCCDGCQQPDSKESPRQTRRTPMNSAL
jgi:hypothetical protein